METETIVLQIATPFSIGTGFYLANYGLVVTNEHVVRDNAQVLVAGQNLDLGLLPVVYLDAYYDLAFLKVGQTLDLPSITFAETPSVGETVWAVGQNYGQRLRTTEGQILAINYAYEDLSFIQHTARLASVQSGGPLFNEAGQLLGVNMYDIDEGHQAALSLPSTILIQCIEEFLEGGGQTASRCFDCQTLNIEPQNSKQHHCRNCGEPIVLPANLSDFKPSGIQATIEDILQACGYEPPLTRRGPNLWEIQQGSARIQLTYHEDSGLLTGDAYLCALPKTPSTELFEYLLTQNYQLNYLTLSTRGRSVLLSLLIYDRYLSLEVGVQQFKHLFAKADYYDNWLVEKFDAQWL